jgi:hypothetical protein
MNALDMTGQAQEIRLPAMWAVEPAPRRFRADGRVQLQADGFAAPFASDGDGCRFFRVHGTSVLERSGKDGKSNAKG